MACKWDVSTLHTILNMQIKLFAQCCNQCGEPPNYQKLFNSLQGKFGGKITLAEIFCKFVLNEHSVKIN